MTSKTFTQTAAALEAPAPWWEQPLQPNTLYVRNLAQRALWLELDGQLSDGHWENARPQEHWMDWCRCQVRTAAPGAPVGRTFYAMRDRYALANPQLLRVVGARMLATVRVALAHGLQVADLLQHHFACGDRDSAPAIEWPSYCDLRSQCAALGVTPEQVEAALARPDYGWRQLRKDLADLQQAMRQDLRAR